MLLESTKVHARPKAPAKWRCGNTAVVSRMRGAAAVEYGLLLPMLLLFILGLMECGRLFWTYTTLDRAAQAAARCGAVNATLCGTSTQIQDYAVTQAYGLTVSASAFTASTPTCGVLVTAS